MKVNVTVPDEVWEKFKTHAEKQYRTPAQHAAYLIDQAVKQEDMIVEIRTFTETLPGRLNNTLRSLRRIPGEPVEANIELPKAAS